MRRHVLNLSSLLTRAMVDVQGSETFPTESYDKSFVRMLPCVYSPSLQMVFCGWNHGDAYGVLEWYARDNAIKWGDFRSGKFLEEGFLLGGIFYSKHESDEAFGVRETYDYCRSVEDPAVQLAISSEPSAIVRFNLATNPALSVEVQYILADDEDYHVRLGLIENDATTNDVLEYIASGDDEAAGLAELKLRERSGSAQVRKAVGALARSLVGARLDDLAQRKEPVRGAISSLARSLIAVGPNWLDSLNYWGGIALEGTIPPECIVGVERFGDENNYTWEEAKQYQLESGEPWFEDEGTVDWHTGFTELRTGRDPIGDWSVESVLDETFYHGTSDIFLDGIMSGGLQPTGATGTEHVWGEAFAPQSNLVYLSSHLNTEWSWQAAIRAALTHGGEPIMLSIKLTHEFLDRLRPDEDYLDLQLFPPPKGGAISTTADLESYMDNLVLYVVKNTVLSGPEAEEYIYKMNEMDPTGDKASYTLWLLHQAVAGFEFGRIEDYLNFYHLNKNKEFWMSSKDIYQYDYYTLKAYVDELRSQGLGREESKREEKHPAMPDFEGIGGVESVYDDGTYHVLKVTSVEGAMLTGEGTAWCTQKCEEAEEYIDGGALYRIYKNGRAYASFYPVGSEVRNVRDYTIDVAFEPDLADVLHSLTPYLTEYERGECNIAGIIKYTPEELGEIASDPREAFMYALMRRQRWPVGEPVIMQDPEYACKYAERVIKGRWPEAEPYIMKDPQWALRYVQWVIGDRWPEAEPYIMKDPSVASHYAERVIGDRWPEAEPYIMKDPTAALHYARRVIKGRWLEAEPYIAQDTQTGILYANELIDRDSEEYKDWWERYIYGPNRQRLEQNLEQGAARETVFGMATKLLEVL